MWVLDMMFLVGLAINAILEIVFTNVIHVLVRM